VALTIPRSNKVALTIPRSNKVALTIPRSSHLLMLKINVVMAVLIPKRVAKLTPRSNQVVLLILRSKTNKVMKLTLESSNKVALTTPRSNHLLMLKSNMVMAALILKRVAKLTPRSNKINRSLIPKSRLVLTKTPRRNKVIKPTKERMPVKVKALTARRVANNLAATLVMNSILKMLRRVTENVKELTPILERTERLIFLNLDPLSRRKELSNHL